MDIMNQYLTYSKSIFEKFVDVKIGQSYFEARISREILSQRHRTITLRIQTRIAFGKQYDVNFLGYSDSLLQETCIAMPN